MGDSNWNGWEWYFVGKWMLHKWEQEEKKEARWQAELDRKRSPREGLPCNQWQTAIERELITKLVESEEYRQELLTEFEPDLKEIYGKDWKREFQTPLPPKAELRDNEVILYNVIHQPRAAFITPWDVLIELALAKKGWIRNETYYYELGKTQQEVQRSLLILRKMEQYLNAAFPKERMRMCLVPGGEFTKEDWKHLQQAAKNGKELATTKGFVTSPKLFGCAMRLSTDRNDYKGTMGELDLRLWKEPYEEIPKTGNALRDPIEVAKRFEAKFIGIAIAVTLFCIGIISIPIIVSACRARAAEVTVQELQQTAPLGFTFTLPRGNG